MQGSGPWERGVQEASGDVAFGAATGWRPDLRIGVLHSDSEGKGDPGGLRQPDLGLGGTEKGREEGQGCKSLGIAPLSS